MNDEQANDAQTVATTELQLQQSRNELRRLLIGSRKEPERGPFRPRSKLMRYLSGNGALALLAVGAGGILLSRPKMAIRLIKLVPMGAVVRTLAFKFLARG